MRKIKFRAFQKSDSQMIEWESVRSNFGWYIDGYEDCELMQFTGLYDKNGKEIYEGDIFLAWFPGMRNNMRATQLVQYEDGCFKSGGMPLYLITKSTLEVIGNVYENPELLTIGY